MKKITFYITAIVIVFTLTTNAQGDPEPTAPIVTEANILPGTSTIKSQGGNFAEEAASSNLALNSTSTEAFIFTKTGATYTASLNGVDTTVDVWQIQTAGGRYLQLQNNTSSGGRLKHRGTTELSTWYIVEGTDDDNNLYYNIITAHKDGEGGVEKTIASTSKDDFLNFQNIPTSLTNFRWRFTMDGLARTLSTNEFDKMSISILNPVNNDIIIRGLDGKETQIEVFSIVGKKILQAVSKGESSAVLSSSKLSSGIYIVKLSKGSSVFTKKIIKN
ncbi:T9SS type A sorting domain-containing protein [Polaribacter septentrionalilitoris]|uniref:T9SS type A sorting domain-containing protein n=1 Tax=Polaribacter septentrionalilitoris TaxID=2494657 RepID=UPI0013590647|nr:T9SS type A sorting domain-containing protein [Polaribacter septentrionalilitoris]